MYTDCYYYVKKTKKSISINIHPLLATPLRLSHGCVCDTSQIWSYIVICGLGAIRGVSPPARRPSRRRRSRTHTHSTHGTAAPNMRVYVHIRVYTRMHTSAAAAAAARINNGRHMVYCIPLLPPPPHSQPTAWTVNGTGGG